MCGISGFIDAAESMTEEALRSTVSAMTAVLAHRGPDDEGVWIEAPAGVAFGHRRLSIIDLSSHGHQPMTSRDGKLTMTFNGEIYNFAELREQLEQAGVRFRGSSDSEVLLEALSSWGLEQTLRRANGMFALAVWDSASRSLWLARDRMGEKPLYYGWLGSSFMFGSTTDALAQHPAFTGELDLEAIGLYLRLNYIPAPHSAYKAINKLPAGTFLRIDPQKPGLAQPEAYWSLREVVEGHLAGPPGVSDEREAIEQLDSLLRQSLSIRMVADVPVGAFLSGGIDSSTTVAVMQAIASRPVRTFTVGFDEGSYDEAESARTIARHLGTDHTEVRLTQTEAVGLVPQLSSIYDEPFGDSSQIPMVLVSRVAREHVKVALSGDGGDELFGGYIRYLMTERLWRRLRPVPYGLRRLAAGGVRSIPTGTWDRLGSVLSPLLPSKARQRHFGDKAHKLADVVESRDARAAYERLVTHWPNPESIVRGLHSTSDWLPGPLGGATSTQWMMFADSTTYLPDDILVKLDRATMSVGLEGRVPLLDHRLVEFAWSLSPEMKIRNGTTKWLTREVLARYVPRPMFDRPKMGFAAPIGDWLRGPLRDWAEDLLSESSVLSSGVLEPEPVRARWKEHLDGSRDWKYALWGVLMLEAFLKRRSPVAAA